MWFHIISLFYYCCGVILKIIVECTKLGSLLIVFLEWYSCNFVSWSSPSGNGWWCTFYYEIINNVRYFYLRWEWYLFIDIPI